MPILRDARGPGALSTGAKAGAERDGLVPELPAQGAEAQRGPFLRRAPQQLARGPHRAAAARQGRPAEGGPQRRDSPRPQTAPSPTNRPPALLLVVSPARGAAKVYVTRRAIADWCRRRRAAPPPRSHARPGPPGGYIVRGAAPGPLRAPAPHSRTPRPWHPARGASRLSEIPARPSHGECSPPRARFARRWQTPSEHGACGGSEPRGRGCAGPRQEGPCVLPPVPARGSLGLWSIVFYRQEAAGRGLGRGRSFHF